MQYLFYFHNSAANINRTAKWKIYYQIGCNDVFIIELRIFFNNFYAFPSPLNFVDQLKKRSRKAHTKRPLSADIGAAQIAGAVAPVRIVEYKKIYSENFETWDNL